MIMLTSQTISSTRITSTSTWLTVMAALLLADTSSYATTTTGDVTTTSWSSVLPSVLGLIMRS